MSDIFETAALAGINSVLGVVRNFVPGGSMGLDVGCDAATLACKMGEAIFPKIKGGLTQEELDAIIQEFKADVPVGTFQMALSAFKRLFDTTILGQLKL
ncbi:MAG TPA: hypothetical protein VN455_02205 [Methanotrichaceae archaeon]|nr:hypothetical protein [Methanotrichaceae archaeon]